MFGVGRLLADSGYMIPRSDGPLRGFDSELAGRIRENPKIHASLLVSGPSTCAVQ